MSFKEFDTVVMKADMPSHGLKSGDVGAVVQLYSADAIEVEFVTASGGNCDSRIGVGPIKIHISRLNSMVSGPTNSRCSETIGNDRWQYRRFVP